MLGTTLNPRQFLDRVASELAKIEPAEIQKLADLIHERYAAGRFVFVIGNGGSGSNASHFCEDMGKGTLARKFFDDDTKKRLKILSLSGNSPNILRAVEWANTHGVDTFGCTGFSGGKLRTLARHGMHVALEDM